MPSLQPGAIQVFAGPEREINAKEITIIARKDNNTIGRKPESSLVPVWGGDMN